MPSRYKNRRAMLAARHRNGRWRKAMLVTAILIVVMAVSLVGVLPKRWYAIAMFLPGCVLATMRYGSIKLLHHEDLEEGWFLRWLAISIGGCLLIVSILFAIDY